MAQFIADLHTHTLLSPCGNLEMTPDAIIDVALQKGIDIIGITDHNSTRHCQLAEYYSVDRNIYVLCGVEITTQEEAHCVAFFPNHDRLSQFQNFLDAHLPNTPNDPDFFGDQVQIDQDFNIIYEEPKLLTSALTANINQIEAEVHALDGIFIPAHIDKKTNSVIANLGFIPFDLNYEAVEISRHGNREDLVKTHKYLKTKPFLRSSDAHQLDQIGTNTSVLTMKTRNFDEIKNAIIQNNIVIK